jgi:hypothetical protein
VLPQIPMPSAEKLPDKVEAEAASLLAELRALGWTVFAYRHDPRHFDNWSIDLQLAARTIRLVKDRSQYMFDGPRTEELKAAGLWKAFDDFEEFRQAVILWVNQPHDRRPTDKSAAR